MNQTEPFDFAKFQDPYLNSFLYIFTNHSKLQNYLTDEYIDFDNRFIDVKRLMEISKPWSRSEQFMLRLALHLYCGHAKIDLNEADSLDQQNLELVMNALCLRFKFDFLDGKEGFYAIR
ncbi:hypothetical protein [Lentibacillus cibarius]|uniref:Uncharacterized protein n=1 Tax=Lentibacillus cibarius TaxID=2583219 RepID=A0A5S3QJG4_9BACI|nr:hypothetical protein [Lentibacillus cibarius]TMN21869.1 hypothetical protein FFL34_06875 [Lentibacillus cibarius]